VPAAERGPADALRGRLQAEFDRHIDLNAILAGANAAAPRVAAAPAVFRKRAAAGPVRIGVARDAALNFYYQENLDLLECMGAQLVPFSVLDGERLPRELQGLYLGGGFPELFAARIAANVPLRDGVRDFFRAGGAIYAECGGLMILCDALVDLDGRRHEMFGLVPATSVMRRDRLSLGYVEVETLADTLTARAGARYRAQTFHHSVLEGVRFTPALKLYHGAKATLDGCAERNLFATYVHAHFAAQPALAERFVGQCRSAVATAH
jgi:cobyrinic acid a,c-diamide synthase